MKKPRYLPSTVYNNLNQAHSPASRRLSSIFVPARPAGGPGSPSGDILYVFEIANGPSFRLISFLGAPLVLLVLLLRWSGDCVVVETERVGRDQIPESAGRRVDRMAQSPTKTMAVALLTPALASGRRVLALFKSVFALVLDVLRSAFRHALHLFFPPASATAPASSSAKPLDQQTGEPQLSSTPLPPPASESHPSHRVDQVGIPPASDSDDSMAATAAPLPPGTNKYLKKRPTVIPALPILPLPLPKRDNRALKTTPSAASSVRSATSATLSSSAGTTVTRLSNGVANLRLEGALSGKGPATAARPAADENAASAGTGNARASAQTTANADPFSNPPFLDLGANGDSREVLRAPAVPMMHDVSQTSKLKETASSKASDDGVLAQVKPDTPEQAAERAIHSGFMREALDMVRCGCIFLSVVPLWLPAFAGAPAALFGITASRPAWAAFAMAARSVVKMHWHWKQLEALERSRDAGELSRRTERVFHCTRLPPRNHSCTTVAAPLPT